MTSARAASVFAANLALERLNPAWASAMTAAAVSRESQRSGVVVSPTAATSGGGVIVAEAVFWRALAAKAMDLMDLALARRSYRALCDPGMALSLESIALSGEDTNVIAGGCRNPL